MLALVAANTVGVVLFGTLYALAGAELLPQLSFVIGLVVLFVVTTLMWVRVEARHRTLAAVPRLGRVVAALGLVVVATPVAVLGPVFWLDERLPDEVGLHAARGGIMAVVLIALALVGLVNVAGGFVAVTRVLMGRR